LSYTAGVKPVGRKYIPNAIDTLLTKMNRQDFSQDDTRIRARWVVTVDVCGFRGSCYV
jgi:hypothetical protein